MYKNIKYELRAWVTCDISRSSIKVILDFLKLHIITTYGIYSTTSVDERLSYNRK